MSHKASHAVSHAVTDAVTRAVSHSVSRGRVTRAQTRPEPDLFLLLSLVLAETLNFIHQAVDARAMNEILR